MCSNKTGLRECWQMYKQEQKKEPNSWLAACLIDFTEIMIQPKREQMNEPNSWLAAIFVVACLISLK